MAPEEMSSPERVRAALTGVVPDRVPVVEFLIDPKVIGAMAPGAADEAEACDRLGLDAVSCLAGYRRVWQEGTDYRDEWGGLFRETPQIVPHPIKPAVTNWEELRAWEAPDPLAPHRLEKLRGIISRYKGKRAIFFHHRVDLQFAAYVANLEQILESMLTDPGFVHELFRKVWESNLVVIREAVRAGAEVVNLADDYAGNLGPMFSPAAFREFMLPNLQRAVDLVHEEGALAVKHSDGYLWPLLEDIVNTGVDGLNPLEPMAGMELGEVKAAYGERVCLVGNIDCGELLSHGSTEAVEAAVRTAIRTAAPGGRYMLASSNSIHASVRPENYAAMLVAGRKYGDYAHLGEA